MGAPPRVSFVTALSTLALSMLLMPSPLHAWAYGEHQTIGDEAFQRFMDRLAAERHESGEEVYRSVPQAFGFTWDSTSRTFYVPELSQTSGTGETRITYGTLNALSGDHESDPLLIEENLKYRFSKLNQTVALQDEWLAKFHVAAPDSDVAELDFKYAILAAVDLSHFYDYGESFDTHLAGFEKRRVVELQSPVNVTRVFRELRKTNAITEYTTLHAAAVTLAEYAGGLAATDPAGSRRYLFYAFLYNAYADHFLEDAFAGGHLVVNRSPFMSVVNNKALHDFYNEFGVKVANLRGETWTAYGDRQFNRRHAEWEEESAYADIEYPQWSRNADRTINAVVQSIWEVWQAYERGRQAGHVRFVDRIPDDQTQVPAFLLAEFTALSIIPVPFNTDIRQYDVPVEELPVLEQRTQLLEDRNFVKSRVANSLIVSFGGGDNKGDTVDVFEVRLNLGAPIHSFSYNAEGRKQGVVDQWLGPTVSFVAGGTGEQDADWQTLKGGGRYIADWWLTNSRFLAMFADLEVGLQWSEGKTRIAGSPSVGVQLGPLLGIKFYEFPAWARIPLQYLLPLNLRFSTEVASGRSPIYYATAGIDVLY